MEMSKVRRFAVAVAVLCLSLWAASGAMAQNAHPCADDAKKFCKDVVPGGGRLAGCLREHANELSPACKERIAEVKKRAREFHQACEDDVMRLCKGVVPGGGRILQCLKDHENELSPECKAKMMKGRK
jgi:hypothetical protein